MQKNISTTKAKNCSSVIALGHNKAEMNDRIAKDYAEELTRREFDVPTDDDVEKRGIFNGDGAW